MMSKIICFDARMAQASGIGVYIQGLLKSLSKQLPINLTLTLLRKKEASSLPGKWPSISINAPIYSVAEQALVPWGFYRSGATLLHVPHYNLPMLTVSHSLVTVHDLIHLKFPEFLPSRLAYAYAQTLFRLVIPKTRAILTVSENTKKDLMEMLRIPETQITVTSLAATEDFHPLTPAEFEPVLNSLGLMQGYFLYVGNLKEFKNVQRLLQAYKGLKQKHTDAPRLVFIGRNFIPGFDQELERNPDVQWFQNLDRRALPHVYAGALALVFPSLYEGFGLPPLEAMACGVPVICSNRASLPEVVGDAALMIDPLSLNDLIRALQRMWTDPSLRSSLSAKGLQRAAHFSWERTAEKTLAVYQQCLS